MLDYRVSDRELAELRAAHRAARNPREAYRFNAIILLASGWTAAQVAEALLIEPDSVRTWFKRYRLGGIDALVRMNYVGSEALLSPEQLSELEAHLNTQLQLSAAGVVRWVKERWGVEYTISGMTALLHRLGYVYKKPKLLPGKPDAERQRAFLAEQEAARRGQEPQPTYYVDAVHPQHNPVLARGWIKRGKRFPLRSNTGRRRLNINGAIEIAGFTGEFRFDPTIDAASAIALFRQIEAAHPEAPVITVYCDNAPYYRAKAVSEYLAGSRIELIFLPPYSPNLNLIERLWKFFKKQVLYNRYYERFDDFQQACRQFFDDLGRYADELRTLLAPNFEIIGE